MILLWATKMDTGWQPSTVIACAETKWDAAAWLRQTKGLTRHLEETLVFTGLVADRGYIYRLAEPPFPWPQFEWQSAPMVDGRGIVRTAEGVWVYRQGGG